MLWNDLTSKSPVFHRHNGTRVKIDERALTQMFEFRQWAIHHQEAGGILLGRHLLHNDDVVIDEVTVPMPGDQRGRLRFHRDSNKHQSIINTRWRESRGTCIYLGEWHTHPESHPMPSRIDINDWQRRLRTDRFDGESLLFLIVGTEALGAWEGIRCTQQVVPL